MIPLLLLFLAFFAPSLEAAACTCHSIGNVTFQRPNAVSADLALPDGADFMWSNDPAMRNLTNALYARPIFATMVCACREVRRTPTVRYIVSATQTAPDGPSARSCLGTAVMTETCAVMADLKLMTCANAWSSGMSGFAHAAAVETGVVVDAVRRIARRKAGACAATIGFEGALDAVTNDVIG